MIASCIVIRDHEVSEQGYTTLVASSKKVGNKFTIQKFEAITPQYVDETMATHHIKWNYPWQDSEIDFATGLKKSAYQTSNPKARIACALSHYSLWKQTVNLKQPMLIFEHDALCINPIDFDISNTRLDIIGINDPRGCTRKSKVFFDQIASNPQPLQPVPQIDDVTIPQGLAGNSAYMITPSGAQQMLRLVKDYGLWPNDALMCRQLVRRMGVTKKFYTHIQNLRSTTVL